MKLISETRAIEKLAEIRGDFAAAIRGRFEQNAKSCSDCATPGACCLDEHFVNVRVTRLEARAIFDRLESLPEGQRMRVLDRAGVSKRKFGLDLSASVTGTYACPLYEKGAGCLVHDAAKPLPCIAHACYERKEDVPPPEMLDEAEERIARLNRLAYGKADPPVPIPLAILRRGSP